MNTFSTVIVEGLVVVSTSVIYRLKKRHQPCNKTNANEIFWKQVLTNQSEKNTVSQLNDTFTPDKFAQTYEIGFIIYQ